MRAFRRWFLVLALCAFGCAPSELLASDAQKLQPRSKRVFLAHGSERLPSETVTDWVSYADAVAVISVVSESAFEPDEEVKRNGEGYIGRSVTAVVEQVVWEGDGAAKTAGNVEMFAAGWWFKNGERFPICINGAQRLDVGIRYLASLVQFHDGWGLLASSSAAPLAGYLPELCGAGGGTIAREFSMLQPSEVRRRLDDAPRDPRVEAHRNLRPEERRLAVTVAARQ